MPDLGVQLNCPLCGAPMSYIESDGATHIYRCLRHSLLILGPDGIFRQQPH
jgi:hypothetical protein